MYGSEAPEADSGGPGAGSGGGSGGPSWGSETVFGTDVRNRQCSDHCSEPTQNVVLRQSSEQTGKPWENIS